MLRYEYFVGTPPFLKVGYWAAMETMQFHRTKTDLFFRTICLHLSGPIEQIYIHKKMSYVFNVGVITHWV